jgi:hypothetical protein
VTDILGIPVPDIPDDYTPVGVYALVECLDSDGDHTFVIRHAGMDPLRRFGALQVLVQQEVVGWQNCFEPLDDGT